MLRERQDTGLGILAVEPRETPAVVVEQDVQFGARLRGRHTAFQAAYTPEEIQHAIQESGLTGSRLDDSDPDYIYIERRGETDPGSWVTAREQYR